MILTREDSMRPVGFCGGTSFLCFSDCLHFFPCDPSMWTSFADCFLIKGSSLTVLSVSLILLFVAAHPVLVSDQR